MSQVNTWDSGGDQEYQGPVTVDSSLTFSGYAVWFLSTLDGTVASADQVTIIGAGGGIVFDGNVGGLVPLASLDVSGDVTYVSEFAFNSSLDHRDDRGADLQRDDEPRRFRRGVHGFDGQLRRRD